MTARPHSTATTRRRRRKRPTSIVYPKKKASRVGRDIEGAVIRDLKRLIPYLRKTRSRSAADVADLYDNMGIRLHVRQHQHGRVWWPMLLEKLLHVAWSHSQMIGTAFDVARISKGKFDPAETWLGRFASIHLPEVEQAAIEEAQRKPPEPFNNKGRADYLGVTWEMRQALKLWSFAACDMTWRSSSKLAAKRTEPRIESAAPRSAEQPGPSRTRNLRND